MNINTTITIDTALNTGLALLGYFYIVFCSGRWLSLLFLKKWNKRRKQDERQKAMNAFSEAFGIDGMEPGDPARAISRGGVVILVYRSEEKNDDHKTTCRKNHISP
ncbi:DUF4752 family protein [Escherichia coli]|uniref:DUF4752 family protein n=1 Tax=Escherichia coli TaxID=562 RepID=UPI00050B4C38|nr:DUF4752 family protein [Escherichia coli]EFQ1315766.1 DUF4752 family protein [Shigella sonnei]EFE7248099.1 DUF4752 family protein [Escherichia coli]EFK3830262.1 DUF4752 family protein [Escherichia coli]EFS1203328.1 DUF4752 family protein [Escherichia coli]EFS1207932.1 DUF4752 family protein [Escherichia coli]